MSSFRLPQNMFLLEDVSTVLPPQKGGDFIRWRRALDSLLLRFPRNWVDICTFSLLDLGLHTGGALNLPQASLHARGRSRHHASLHLAGRRGCSCFICAIYSLSLSGFDMTKWCGFFISLLSLPRLGLFGRHLISLWVHWLGRQSEFYKANSVY